MCALKLYFVRAEQPTRRMLDPLEGAPLDDTPRQIPREPTMGSKGLSEATDLCYSHYHLLLKLAQDQNSRTVPIYHLSRDDPEESWNIAPSLLVSLTRNHLAI